MEHERLTQRNNIGGAYYPHCFQESTCYGLGASVKCNSCEFNNEVLEKLATYEDLEEQGLLLKLPVPIGEEVYCITDNFGVNEISKNVVLSYVTAPKNIGGVIARGYMGTLLGIVGKRVFATKEEAEQALKQMGE